MSTGQVTGLCSHLADPGRVGWKTAWRWNERTERWQCGDCGFVPTKKTVAAVERRAQ